MAKGRSADEYAAAIDRVNRTRERYGQTNDPNLLAELEDARRNLDIFETARTSGMQFDPKFTTLFEARDYLTSKNLLDDSRLGYLGQAKRRGYAGSDIGEAYSYLDSFSASADRARGAGFNVSDATTFKDLEDYFANSQKQEQFNEAESVADPVIQEQQELIENRQEEYSRGPASGFRAGEHLSPAEAYEARNPGKKAGERQAATDTDGLPTFQYVDAQGNLQTIRALNEADAMRLAPNIAKTSGVMLVSSPQQSSGKTRTRSEAPPSGGMDSVSNVANNLLASYGYSISPTAQQNFKMAPAKSFAEIYTEVSKSINLPSVKKQIDETIKKIDKLDQELADKTADINENPWLSEGVRRSQIQELEERYDLKRAPHASNLTLLQDTYNNGREEARYAASETLRQYNTEREFQIEQIQMWQDAAEKQLDAQIKLLELEDKLNDMPTLSEQFGSGIMGEYAFAVSQGFQGSFIDYQNEDANRKKSIARAGATQYQIQDANTADVATRLNSARGSDGYTDPNLYARLRESAKISPTEFDNRFGYLVNPQSRARLGLTAAITSGAGGQFLTKDWFKNTFGTEKLYTQAQASGFGRGLFGSKEEAVDKYLASLETTINSYRQAGYDDNKILELMK